MCFWKRNTSFNLKFRSVISIFNAEESRAVKFIFRVKNSLIFAALWAWASWSLNPLQQDGGENQKQEKEVPCGSLKWGESAGGGQLLATVRPVPSHSSSDGYSEQLSVSWGQLFACSLLPAALTPCNCCSAKANHQCVLSALSVHKSGSNTWAAAQKINSTSVKLSATILCFFPY